MSIATWLRTPRIRRGLAASTIVLAAGGLILFRAPSAHGLGDPGDHFLSPPSPQWGGTNSTTFGGYGARGQLALSHGKVLAGSATQIFAEVRIAADASATATRAPLSLALVLDTSGSMEGEKIQQAKDSVARLVRDMRDDDEVAFIRYDDNAQVVQPLSRVGDVRDVLLREIRDIHAGGGTAIPRGLAAAVGQLSLASHGRVRRVVLASDGLDSTRSAAEDLAVSAFQRGITVSSMGIGLDFDESYMGAVAHAGHGNFAFVKDASTLAGFLNRELVETASTTIENATVEIVLPPGVRFVRAMGADVQPTNGGNTLTLRLGSLFAGDERRALIELDASLAAGETRGIAGSASWSRIAGAPVVSAIPALSIEGVNDLGQVEASRDRAVLASATSVQASVLQLEAAEVWAKGDAPAAQALMDQSDREMAKAAAIAPAAMATSIAKQSTEYKARKTLMAKPGTEQGNIAAKKAVADDNNNLGRAVY